MGETPRNGMNEAAEAARRAADVERLLPGEEPDTVYPDDARHWVEVYSELLAVKGELITVTREARRGADPAVQTELSGTDLPIMEHERTRFETRLAFWTGRLGALEAETTG